MNDVAGQCRILAAFGKAKKAAQGTLICANGERSRHGRSKDPRGWQWGKLRIACRHVNSGQPKEKRMTTATLTTARLRAFNFQNWIKENQHLLKPPVGNKKVFEDGEMTVQVVGGPNERTDYHDDPVEEFFYQLKGNMVLKVRDDGQFYDGPFGAGEGFRHPPTNPSTTTRPRASASSAAPFIPARSRRRDGAR